jgi:hypothetical protein
MGGCQTHPGDPYGYDQGGTEQMAKNTVNNGPSHDPFDPATGNPSPDPIERQAPPPGYVNPGPGSTDDSYGPGNVDRTAGVERRDDDEPESRTSGSSEGRTLPEPQTRTAGASSTRYTSGRDAYPTDGDASTVLAWIDKEPKQAQERIAHAREQEGQRAGGARKGLLAELDRRDRTRRDG